ncbi:MAG: hypothetical protein PHE55_03870 [Methylococcaceae bacterium]|nr:hypothetical protein [Methylococcaceae bacterium]
MIIRTKVFLTMGLMFTGTAHAALVNLDGGTLTAYAAASDGGSTSYVNVSNPTPLAVQSGLTTLTAQASGTYPYSPAPGFPVTPVSGSTTASADVHQDLSGGLTFKLSSDSRSALAGYGPGAYAGATANSSATVQFSTSGLTQITLDWSGCGFAYSCFVSGSLTGNGASYFSATPSSAEAHSATHLDLLLPNGQYQASISTNDGGGRYPGNAVTLNVVASPVPIPAAFWLFGSAIAGLRFSFRRPKTPHLA